MIDIVIVGGGAVGSAVAYFLACDPDFDGSILVVEKDPTYAEASTSRSVGGIRQQFSVRENIAMSQFGVQFLKDADEQLRVDDPIDLSFKENGYLFLGGPEQWSALREGYRVQTELNAPVTLLPSSELEKRFPWLHGADLAGGSLGYADAGWFDPHGLLQALGRKARSLGVTFRHDEVVGLERRGHAVISVELSSGERINCAGVVNAAGPLAARVAEMAGITGVPVHPKKRFVFGFRTGARFEGCPLVVDRSGVYFRPEGDGFVCGRSPLPSEDPDSLDFAVDHGMFEREIWPALAHRVPAFDALRKTTSWAGHYAVNVEDHNAVIGPHPIVDNFYLANGFSGHGLQHAPAVGRAIAELIVHGRYTTLDLSRLGFERFSRGALVHELGVV